MKMRYLPIALSLVFGPVVVANAQVSLDVGLPGINIGINMPTYPELVQVPDYPVYYDPQASANYFFYDGQYWVYQRDNWYASSWYDGPWQPVGPENVPLFVLRVPVRYYREPPSYFRGWSADAAPRWGDHWGQSWSAQHGGWDQWNRNSIPAAAPLPIYQRQYSGARYPRTVSQQNSIRSENYHHQPHEAVTQQIQSQRGHNNSRVESQAQNARAQQQANIQQRTQTQQRVQAQQVQTVQRAQTQQHAHSAQRAQTQQRAQTEQRAQTQQRAQMQQRAQTEQRSANRQPQSQPRQPQQALRSAPRAQHAQAASQDKGRATKTAPHDKGGNGKQQDHGQGHR